MLTLDMLSLSRIDPVLTPRPPSVATGRGGT